MQARIIVGVEGTTIQKINTNTLLPISSATLTIALPDLVTRAYSVVFNPNNGMYYILLQLNLSNYYLATVNPTTGVCFLIGYCNLQQSGSQADPCLLFNTNTNVLYAMATCGVSCNYAVLHIVDISTGSVFPVTGIPGPPEEDENIAFNYDDNLIYYWSFYHAPPSLFCKINPSDFSGTCAPFSGAPIGPIGHIFGSIYLGDGLFFATTGSLFSPPNQVVTISSTGFVTVLSNEVSFNSRGFAYYETVLPVELSSFSSSVNKINVTLNWTTATEENNSGFEIHRRDASRKTQDEWDKIGFVQGNGTTTLLHNYEFKDRNLSSGKYKYRLKQIDYNGNFEYYNLSNEVVIGTPEKFSLHQNYPNPFNPVTKINYEIPKEGNVTLKIFDNEGRELKTIVNEFKPAGNYTVEFDGSNLSSGVYFYRIEAGNFIEVRKMTLLK